MRFQITEVTSLRHTHKCYGYLQSFLRHTCLRSVLQNIDTVKPKNHLPVNIMYS